MVSTNWADYCLQKGDLASFGAFDTLIKVDFGENGMGCEANPDLSEASSSSVGTVTVRVGPDCMF